MASGMKIELDQAELFTTLHFVDERRDRAPVFDRIGLAEIDEVAVVRQNMGRSEAMGGAIFPECGDLLRGQGRRAPLTLVFGEHGEGVRANARRIERGIGHAAGDADMGSKVFHRDKFLGFFGFPLGKNRFSV
ncbi:hypothetical protein SDC9_118466 [bioreactor metagenome]|uniref:Uncharacterized protein n=1 Tax=bioreactor metagenome TaxID=1076179 RepID=A0A645C3H0_9ZZZZ